MLPRCMLARENVVADFPTNTVPSPIVHAQVIHRSILYNPCHVTAVQCLVGHLVLFV
jgi:hypothetical protein